jgi:iron complex outermembrane receptor protein
MPFDFLRPVVSDKWIVSDFLTVNNRFAYTHRNLDVLRNGDSTSTTVNNLDQVVGRQLREQSDLDNTYDYQLEPVWKFGTGPIGHTLLTGFEAVRQTMATARPTADLPDIANAFAPVPPEASVNGLQFQCDAKHSCDNDRLYATYLNAYATDQIDVIDRWKIRDGVRQDWWDTTLDPLITVPGRFTSAGVPIIGGVA